MNRGKWLHKDMSNISLKDGEEYFMVTINSTRFISFKAKFSQCKRRAMLRNMTNIKKDMINIKTDIDGKCY